MEMELREIPESYRTVVLLRDIEGLAYEEIADILQLSLGTVKSRVTRGRDALRKRLEKHVHELGLAVAGERKRPRATHDGDEEADAGAQRPVLGNWGGEVAR